MDVSVIIPVFNGEATVGRAIDSVLAQELDGEFDVVVVNDGSTDGTAKVLAPYGDHIRVVTQENRGRSAARNIGARNSTGEYLAFLDADDEWCRDKLAKTISAVEREADCGLAYTDAVPVNSLGTVVADSCIPAALLRAPTLEDLLHECWSIPTSTVVMRRSVFDHCGGFNEEFGRRWGYEDHFIWLRAREIAPFVFLPHRLALCRVSNCLEVFDKRRSAVRSTPLSEDSPDPWRFISGEMVFERLVQQRYGSRASALLRSARADKARVLHAAGLAAIFKGDGKLARRLYAASLKLQPWQIRPWIRLAWALAPTSARSRVAPVLPRRIARSLEGPPFDPYSELDGPRGFKANERPCGPLMTTTHPPYHRASNRAQ